MKKCFVFILIILIFQNTILFSQVSKIYLSIFDGIVIIGYVDHGGFSNFTGPNINFTKNNSKFILGALPSLRYKTDHSSPKNSFVTPNLGIGFTYSYKILALQLPLYYNPKTTFENGKWHLGFGLGLRLNALNKN